MSSSEFTKLNYGGSGKMVRSALGEIATETQNGLYGLIFSFLASRRHGLSSSLSMNIKKNNQLGCIYTTVRYGKFVRRHRLRKSHWRVQFEPFSVEADFRHHLERSILSAPDQETRKSLEHFRVCWLRDQDWQLSVHPTVKHLSCKRRRVFQTYTVLDLLLD